MVVKMMRRFKLTWAEEVCVGGSNGRVAKRAASLQGSIMGDRLVYLLFLPRVNSIE